MSVLLLWFRSCNLQSLHCPRQPAYCLFGRNWFKSVCRDLCVPSQGQNAENALPWFSKEDFHLDATLAGMGTLQSEVPLSLPGSSKRARMSLKNLLEVNPSWKKLWLDLNFVPRRADLKSRDAKACCTAVAERQSTMCDSAQLLFYFSNGRTTARGTKAWGGWKFCHQGGVFSWKHLLCLFLLSSSDGGGVSHLLSSSTNLKIPVQGEAFKVSNVPDLTGQNCGEHLHGTASERGATPGERAGRHTQEAFELQSRAGIALTRRREPRCPKSARFNTLPYAHALQHLQKPCGDSMKPSIGTNDGAGHVWNCPHCVHLDFC